MHRRGGGGRRCLLPAVTGEASTTRCRVAPAHTNPNIEQRCRARLLAKEADSFSWPVSVCLPVCLLPSLRIHEPRTTRPSNQSYYSVQNNPDKTMS